MPGIADQPAAQLQLGASSPISGGAPDVDVTLPGLSQQTTQSFDNLMGAFRSGFITADDIKKRQIVGTTDAEAMREENIARKAGAQQSQIDIGEVRPRQRELAKAQLEGTTAEQTLLNRMNSADTTVSHPAREEFAQRQLDAQATALYGTPTPAMFKAANREPEDFETWKNRQVNAFQGSDTARADYSNHLDEKGEQGEEYAKYKKAVKEEKVPLTPGTPAYRQALREDVHERLTYEQLAQINFDVMKESAIARGKAEAERPVKQAATAAEMRKEYSQLPQLHDFEKVDASYHKLLAATDPDANPTPLRDQAAIFSWMKILDPGSTVREGEYASVKNARGVPDRVRNYYNQVLTGQILTAEQRKELREASRPIYQGQLDNIAPRIRQYLSQEQSAGLAPGTVVPLEHRALLESGVAAPKSATPQKTALPPNFAPPTSKEIADAPTYPALNAVPSNVRVYKTPDGKPWGNPNYKP